MTAKGETRRSEQWYTRSALAKYSPSAFLRSDERRRVLDFTAESEFVRTRNGAHIPPPGSVEGWMESLAPEVPAFGIRTMLAGPGYLRTQLLSAGSTTYAESSIEDYAERTRETVAAWSGMDGKQGGDPAKLADAFVPWNRSTTRPVIANQPHAR